MKKNDQLMMQADHSATEPEAVPTKRGRRTVQERMSEIILQQTQLSEQRKALEGQIQAESRKRKAKLESIIGAACLADDSTHEIIRAALEKHVTDPKLRLFLKSQGWK